MNKSCLKCVNKEEVVDNEFIVCEINGLRENINLRMAETEANFCPCYKEEVEE